MNLYMSVRCLAVVLTLLAKQPLTQEAGSAYVIKFQSAAVTVTVTIHTISKYIYADCFSATKAAYNHAEKSTP